MAWGFVQEAQGSSASGGSTFGVTFTASGIVVANRILVGVSCWNSTAPTVTGITDSAGNTYRGPIKRLTVSDGTDITLWDAVITAGGGTKPTVSAAVNNTGNEIAMLILEYSGLSTATTGYTDGVAGTATSTPVSPITSGATSPVPGASNELAIGLYGDGGNGLSGIGVSSGWTQRGTTILGSSVAEIAWEDQNSTSGTGSNGSFTLNPPGSPGGVIAAIYKLAAVVAYQRRPSSIYVPQAVNRAGSF